MKEASALSSSVAGIPVGTKGRKCPRAFPERAGEEWQRHQTLTPSSRSANHLHSASFERNRVGTLSSRGFGKIRVTTSKSSADMTRFWQGKLKRKDLEEVYDDFAEFSLSSPARKIRRLDADLPPILEQGEPTSTSTCNQPFQHEESSASSSDVPKFETTASVTTHVHPFDNERALVLYKPVEMPLMLSPEPTSFSLQVNRGFMDGLNHVFKPRNLDFKSKDQLRGGQDNCLAVIPWIPSQVSSSSGTEGYVSGSQLTQEQKEAEDDEVAFMEIEEDRQQPMSGGLDSEGFQQQQHCLNAQLPPKSSNSVLWSW